MRDYKRILGSVSAAARDLESAPGQSEASILIRVLCGVVGCLAEELEVHRRGDDFTAGLEPVEVVLAGECQHLAAKRISEDTDPVGYFACGSCGQILFRVDEPAVPAEETEVLAALRALVGPNGLRVEALPQARAALARMEGRAR